MPRTRSVPVPPRTKHPDVAGRREASEVDGLGGHPLDGETGDGCCGGGGRRGPCLWLQRGRNEPLAPSCSPYLYNTPRPRCTWRARSPPASRTPGRPPGCSSPRCPCEERPLVMEKGWTPPQPTPTRSSGSPKIGLRRAPQKWVCKGLPGLCLSHGPAPQICLPPPHAAHPTCARS